MREALRAPIEREGARRLARLGGSEPQLAASAAARGGQASRMMPLERIVVYLVASEARLTA